MPTTEVMSNMEKVFASVENETFRVHSMSQSPPGPPNSPSCFHSSSFCMLTPLDASIHLHPSGNGYILTHNKIKFQIQVIPPENEPESIVLNCVTNPGLIKSINDEVTSLCFTSDANHMPTPSIMPPMVFPVPIFQTNGHTPARGVTSMQNFQAPAPAGKSEKVRNFEGDVNNDVIVHYQQPDNYCVAKDFNHPRNFETLQTYKGAPNFETLQNYNSAPNFETVQNYNGAPNVETVQNYNTPPHFETVQNYNTPPHFETVQNYNTAPNFETVQNYNPLQNGDDFDYAAMGSYTAEESFQVLEPAYGSSENYDSFGNITNGFKEKTDNSWIHSNSFPTPGISNLAGRRQRRRRVRYRRSPADDNVDCNNNERIYFNNDPCTSASSSSMKYKLEQQQPGQSTRATKTATSPTSIPRIPNLVKPFDIFQCPKTGKLYEVYRQVDCCKRFGIHQDFQGAMNLSG